jgi:sulfur-oxidizing protein SoxX
MMGNPTRRFDVGAALLLVLLLAGTVPPLQAAGQAPDPKVCNDAANPPKDIVTQGGCIAIGRAQGNCQACHFIAGTPSGNIAPPLVGMAQRFPDKARLRAQVFDATQANPRSVMPPYGRHEILSEDEIDKLVAWLLTL